MWIVTGGFGEKRIIKLQCSVHLVCGNVVKTVSGVICFPFFLCCLKQAQCSHYVCLSKGKRVFNTPIHMTFRSQVYHIGNFVLIKNSKNILKVANIRFYKFIIGVTFNIRQIGQITRIS